MLPSNYLNPSQQYHSHATEQPTITLGTHMDLRNNKLDSNSARKQYRRGQNQYEEEYLEQRKNYQIELSNCRSEIQTLKEQVELEEREKAMLEDTIISLKKDLSLSSKEYNKLFQESEKNKQLVEKLKIDNKSMEMEIDKFRSERKAYQKSIDNIDSLKKEISISLAEKNNILEETSHKLRKIERTHSECRLKIEQLQRMLSESEIEKKQLMSEVKSNLEKYLMHSNIITKMEFQLKDMNDLNKSMKEKIFEMEKERQELYMRLGYDINEERQSLNESSRSNYPACQRSMVQIQSYMREIENMLDIKKDEKDRKRKGNDQLRYAIECLKKNL